MRNYAWLFLSFGLVLSLHGCGDDGGTGGTGNTGGGGGGTAMVSGTVLVGTGDTDVGVEGATVSVVGSTESTTSGPGGAFELEVPVGSLFLHATATEAWGVAAYQVVPAGGVTEVELELVSEDDVGQVEGALGMTADPAKGIVAVLFVDSDTATAVGGETATLSEVSDFSFVFDDEDNPELGTELIAGGGTDLIFVGVGLTDSLTVTATDAADASCPSDATTYPVLEKTVTDVDLNCP